ncbi:MAG: DUF1934 domain-containing protein [Firmicutes bacterium]|jgi:uncharacterized beta-barrel protein YwiB (DUF1934 family)|nr:DUF1934 domain-containing protein [Bacillota bacterium]
MLKITGKTADEDDGIEFITEGKFCRKGPLLFIQYPESELSGMEGCTTSLTVGKNKVRLRRSGEPLAVDTVMEFEKGKRFLGVYETPFGPLGMEILTDSIEKELEEDGRGRLSINYSVSLKGVSDARKTLDIELTPKTSC